MLIVFDDMIADMRSNKNLIGYQVNFLLDLES